MNLPPFSRMTVDAIVFGDPDIADQARTAALWHHDAATAALADPAQEAEHDTWAMARGHAFGALLALDLAAAGHSNRALTRFVEIYSRLYAQRLETT